VSSVARPISTGMSPLALRRRVRVMMVVVGWGFLVWYKRRRLWGGRLRVGRGVGVRVVWREYRCARTHLSGSAACLGRFCMDVVKLD
jgi:hypothetical protein